MGRSGNLTTTAARWLFKTGSNKIVTRPFVGLGGEIEASSREYSKNLSSKSTAAAKGFVAPVLKASSSFCTLNFCAPSTPCPSSASATLKTGFKPFLPSSISNLPSPTAAAVPLAFHSVKRSFSSVPPIKDNELNSVSKDLTQNKKTPFSKKTIEELKEDVDERSIASVTAERKAVAAKGENAVKLWEESKKEDQAFIEVLDQYIVVLQEAKTKTPLTLKIDWNQRIEEAQDHRLSMVCSILNKEVCKVEIIASIVQDKAVAARGVDAIKLWEEAKKADEVVIEAQDQYIKVLKEAQAKAPLAAKAKWNQYLEPAQNERASRVCNLFSKEANKLLTMVSIASEKASVAKGVEAVKLWEEAKKAAQTLLEVQDQYIASLQEAKGKAPEAAQVGWGQRIEVARHNRGTMVYSLLSREADRLAAIVSVVTAIDDSFGDKASVATGEEAIRLWEESKKMNQELLEIQDQYLAALEETKIKAPTSEKAHWVQRIEVARYIKAITPCSTFLKESNRVLTIASIAKKKASVATGEEAVRLWEESKKAYQDSLKSYDQYIAAFKKVQREAPLKFQIAHDQQIKSLQNNRDSIYCGVIFDEVTKATVVASIIEDKAVTARGEESVKLFEEAKEANQNVIGFQDQYIKVLQEARAKAPLEAQTGWDQRIESAQNRRVLMVFRMRYHDINKAMVIAFIAEGKALAAQGEEAVKLLEESRKTTQIALEIQDQCIASLQEAQEKAPLTAKEELTQRIEQALYRRATMAYSAIAKQADKLDDIFINAYNKAPLIKGEKDVRFWGQSKQLAQSLLEEVDLYIEFLQNVEKRASVGTKTDWKQYIENANHKRIDIVCSLYTQKILEADAIDHVAHHKASTAQGEEAVKLWEASKQTSQVISELRGQYIKVLQEIQEKAPLEMKLALKQAIEKLQYENAETIYNIFVKEVSKLGIISTMSYEKAAAAQEEDAVKLWAESKEAAQALLEAQDQYMKNLQEVKAKAPREIQKTWARRIDIAQEDRDMIVCSICSREVYRLNFLDHVVEAKLFAAQDVEALKLWEESKQVSDELIAAQDHYIEALQKAMARPSEISRPELVQGMEEVCEERILTVCSILKKEVFKANVIATIANDKAVLAQGSEAIRLWEEAKQAHQVLLETHDHYIKALKEAQEKASLATKSEWNQRIEEAENIRPSIVSSVLEQEAKKEAAIASATQDKSASDKDIINNSKK